MIEFIKYRSLYFLLSAVVIGAGMFSIATYGFRTSIDFTGGTIMEYQTKKPILEKNLRTSLGAKKIQLQEFDSRSGTVTLRFDPLSTTQEKLVTAVVQAHGGSATVLRSETVGATLGRETIMKTLVAAIVAILGILAYMAFSFKGIKFAVAAIVALLHDLLVMIGGYALVSRFFGAELNTLFVTALLTTMSFSVHDTIIIFDKIREYRRSKVEEPDVSANRALTETLIRSINNSMTILFMMLALILFGGSTIRFFIVALLIGTITGTYSSPFIATPVWYLLERRK